MALPITNALAQPQPATSYQDSLQQLKLRVPDGYQAGPLQKAQEAGISNANELAMQGPDGDFWRALKQFQDHFSANGANGGQV